VSPILNVTDGGNTVPETNTKRPLLPGAACRQMGVHTSTLRRWIERGLIHVKYTAGGQVRVPVAEIERIAKTGKDRRLMEQSAFEAASPEHRAELTREQMAQAVARGREIARRVREKERLRQMLRAAQSARKV
jgi:excisionase family DNA binding protein